MLQVITSDLIIQDIFFLILVISIYLIQKLFQKFLIKIVTIKNNLIIDDIVFFISLFSRIIAGFIIVFITTLFFSLPFDIILVYSAIIGTVISLSSIQVMNNIISGMIIILLIKPFRIYDYIAIGNMEGVVSEITLNYTKLKTMDGNYVLIPNRSILKSDITNYTIYKESSSTVSKVANLKRYYDAIPEMKINQYSFQLSAPIDYFHLHAKIFDDIFTEYKSIFGYKPTYFMYSMGVKLEYTILVFVSNSRILRKNIKNFRTKLILELNKKDLAQPLINPASKEE